LLASTRRAQKRDRLALYLHHIVGTEERKDVHGMIDDLLDALDGCLTPGSGEARRQEIRWIRRIQLLRNFLAAGQNQGGGFSKGAAGPVAFER
jgi:hypothetical protein